MDNKVICVTFLEEVHNKNNLGAIDTYIANDVVSHDPFPGQKPGKEGLRETMEIFNKAFPDKKIKINDALAEGDKVMVKVTCTGTHQGEFMSIVPTGNTISYEEVLIFRIKNGKIVEHWAVADALSLMSAVGAVEMKF